MIVIILAKGMCICLTRDFPTILNQGPGAVDFGKLTCKSLKLGNIKIEPCPLYFDKLKLNLK